jgi:AcrR family transcriptional regulator
MLGFCTKDGDDCPMGVKERRDRERLEMRRAILDAARKIAAQDGWQAVTIRRVAEMIEYSPPTIYEYFENKEAILCEELREGFRLLLEDLRGARDAAQAPEQKFRALGDAYWNFAWKHPELYQVISGLGSVGFGAPEHCQEGEAVGELFRGALQAVLPPGRWSTAELNSKVLVLWSLYHGFITLVMADRIRIGGREWVLGLAQQAVRDLVTAWRAA